MEETMKIMKIINEHKELKNEKNQLKQKAKLLTEKLKINIILENLCKEIEINKKII